MSTTDNNPNTEGPCWIPDPANIDGKHEDYLARFGGTDLILSLRRRRSRRGSPGQLYDDWTLHTPDNRHTYAVSYSEPGMNRDEAFTTANGIARIITAPPAQLRRRTT